MANNKPIPKTQKELSEDTTMPYLNQGVAPSTNLKNRELQRSVKNDDVKPFTIGLRDIDEAIFYYFENVIRPTVIRNGRQVNVPVLYGSPERWKAVQKDGFYRDRNGKIMTPLIMIKRDSLEKNRNLGNKLDANSPLNYGIFEKKYSKKNFYDRFSLLTNRDEVKEYQGVVIPDFVNITYSCIIFTQYVEQMNKIVEGINYASDSYWGDPNKFNFRAMIDSYTTATEMNQGEDRTVRTNFTLNLLGHVIPETINAQIQGSGKYYSKSAVIFGMEVAGTLETLTARSLTADKEGANRFFDSGKSSFSTTTSLNPEQQAYLLLQKAYSSATTPVVVDEGAGTVTWTNLTFADPPQGFDDPPEKDLFQLFINGQLVSGDSIISIVETTAAGPVVVTIDETALGFEISASDEYTIIGKFN